MVLTKLSWFVEWKDLPLDLQHDVAVFRYALTRFIYYAPLQEIFDVTPALTQEREVWEIVIAKTYRRTVKHLLREYAPPHILADRELMRRACGNDEACFEIAAPSLQKDAMLLEELLSLKPDIY